MLYKKTFKQDLTVSVIGGCDCKKLTSYFSFIKLAQYLFLNRKSHRVLPPEQKRVVTEIGDGISNYNVSEEQRQLISSLLALANDNPLGQNANSSSLFQDRLIFCVKQLQNKGPS